MLALTVQELRSQEYAPAVRVAGDNNAKSALAPLPSLLNIRRVSASHSPGVPHRSASDRL